MGNAKTSSAIIVLLVAWFAFVANAKAEPDQRQYVSSSLQLLDPMFQDHAVLQRDQPLAIWGQTSPGRDIVVELAAHQVRTRSGSDGRWRAVMPALSAGGPFVMTATSSDGSRQSISNLMIGDVWLCSGQSNMEFAVRQATNADAEIANASDADLRLFLVRRSSLAAPSQTPRAVGEWQITSSRSVAEFSAACYFMGRDLRRSGGVPVGLISASWGGSIIEDWLSREAMTALGGQEQALNALDVYSRDPAAGETLWREVTQDWWRTHDPGTRQGWHLPQADDAGWASIPGEGFWEGAVAGLETFDGIVWLRKDVQLTASQARQPAVLELGPVDDADVTWINGRYVGGQQGWNTPRVYRVPEGVLKPGRNLIAVGVLDTNGGGGAWGPASDKRLVLGDGSEVSLADGWRHRVAAALGDVPNPPRTPWIGGSGTTTLFNGMIAPLGSWGVKGLAWYQGESNIGDYTGYRRLLPALFEDWRRQFANPQMRILVVQLADFGPRATAPVNSYWAALRESQRQVVNADPLAGLVVAIDIGDRFDIHPTNKLEVGRRLALEANRLDEVALSSGPTRSFRHQSLSPQPLEVSRSEGSAVQSVLVRYPEGSGLVAYGSNRPIGFELCSADNDCRFVDALLSGNDVVLDRIRPDDARVRFCWADSPVCNLYGAGGLPAVPFEADIR